jgi:hypothetical protein
LLTGSPFTPLLVMYSISFMAATLVDPSPAQMLNPSIVVISARRKRTKEFQNV